jgi:hypothetical protein
MISLKAQVNVSGEFRPRTEYSHGYGTLANPDQKASLFTTQRTRLNLIYKSDLFSTKLVLQDVRSYGSQRQLVGNEDFATSIHEAWAELKLFENGYLKIGRQEVIYDDHRIFGSVGWAQQARSHDMAIFKYEGNFKAHLALAYHENTDRTNNLYEGPDAYKALQLIWLHKSYDNLKLSLMFLNNGIPSIDTTGGKYEENIYYSQTYGSRLVYKLNDLALYGNFFYQGGKDGNNNKLSAIETLLEAEYKLSSGLSFMLGWELLSGTDFDEAETNNSFTPFYGTNHKFNGFMDYFYVGNHTNNVGLNDIYFKAKYKKDKFFVATDIHSFSSAAKINNTLDNNLGVELDIWLGYAVSKAVDFKAGYSQMFATESMEALKGGSKDETNNWAWLMLTFKPVFFKSAK